MPKFIDLTGQTFSQLIVIKQVKDVQKRGTYWECECSCGTTITVEASRLKSENTKSCGCLKRKKIIERNFIHGMARSPEHETWKHIIQRCTNPNDNVFKYYGGRGITMCEEWINDFMAFFSYIGQRPTARHSIERIDNNKGYQPGNVKWATQKQQCNNKRNNHRITLNGHTMTLTQWAKFVGINPKTLHSRINLGWPVAKVIFQPIKH